LPRVTVIGTGYLGLTQAVCLADLGHERRVIIDARCGLDAALWHDAGWTVHVLGRPWGVRGTGPRREMPRLVQ
jgi:glycine/D-amino acid oxidase-like deaminating enzyme